MASGVEAVHRDAMHQPAWYMPASLAEPSESPRRGPVLNAVKYEGTYLSSLSSTQPDIYHKPAVKKEGGKI